MEDNIITSFNDLRHVGVCFILYFEEGPHTYKSIVDRFGEQGRIAIQEMIDSGRIAITDGVISMSDAKKLTALEQMFEDARKSYPGTKDGFNNSFKTLKKHKDWKACVPKMIGAIAREKAAKEALKSKAMHCPDWRNFKTWINNRGWEDEFPVIQSEGTSEIYQKYLLAKDNNAPGSVPLSEREVHEWVSSTGQFAGTNFLWSTQGRAEVFWKAHGVKTSIDLKKVCDEKRKNRI